MTAREIAASLTKAQRDCLALICDEHPDPVCTEDERLLRFCDDVEPTDTFNQCANLGLMRQIGDTSYDDWWIIALPLGLAVRAALREMHSDT
jgi:hypothetical protein